MDSLIIFITDHTKKPNYILHLLVIPYDIHRRVGCLVPFSSAHLLEHL